MTEATKRYFRDLCRKPVSSRARCGMTENEYYDAINEIAINGYGLKALNDLAKYEIERNKRLEKELSGKSATIEAVRKLANADGNKKNLLSGIQALTSEQI